MPVDTLHTRQHAFADAQTSTYYAPAYPDGLPDSALAQELPAKPLTAYPSIEDRQSFDPKPYASTPAHTTTVPILLIVSFLLIAYCYRRGAKYFHYIFRNTWSVKRTENHLDEHTANESLLLAALIAVTVIMEGILLHAALAAGVSDWTVEGASNIAKSVAVAGFYYLFQLACLKFTGFVFSEKTETKLWIQGFNATQVLAGLALTPFALAVLFVPQYDKSMIFIAFILYIIARLVFWAKTFRIFYSNIFQCFYFVLYLCALEIAPLLLLFKNITFVYS